MILLSAKQNNMEQKTNAKLRYILEEETNLPYFFDVVVYDKIENVELKMAIDGGEKIFIITRKDVL